MTLRLYSGHLRCDIDRCDGCGAVILRDDKVVLRSDGALFECLPCAVAHDDAVLEPKPLKVVS